MKRKKSNSPKVKWDIHNYDVWGNEEDGFEVNNTFTLARDVLMSSEPTNTEILNVIKEEGLVIDNTRLKDLDIGGDDTYITINESATSYPLGDLTRR